jgi:SAM-dependent methyltransferase
MRREVQDAIGKRIGGSNCRVLDVGGVREMARYATHVIDVMTYDAAKASWGKYLDDTIPLENWAVQDICDPKPFPYPDKYFDFAIASHILEDVRDPVRVCRELSRVAKAGFIETPSAYVELTRGVDPSGRSYIGYYHHRWLVRPKDGGLEFLFKPHFLTSSRRFHFPRRYRDHWEPARQFVSLFWEGEIRAVERVVVVRDELEQEIESIVREVEGDIPAMKWARYRHKARELGSAVVVSMGLRETLRPAAEWIVRRFS